MTELWPVESKWQQGAQFPGKDPEGAGRALPHTFSRLNHARARHDGQSLGTSRLGSQGGRHTLGGTGGGGEEGASQGDAT